MITSPRLQVILKAYISNKYEKTARRVLLKTLQDSNPKDYDKNFILVYGSLRKDEYNYTRYRGLYGSEELVYISDAIIRGYVLVDLGNYPAAVYNADASILECQLMYVSDRVYQAIRNMELSAGYELYTERAEVLIEEDRIGIIELDLFAATQALEKQIEGMPVVESGNWSEYLQETYAESN